MHVQLHLSLWTPVSASMHVSTLWCSNYNTWRVPHSPTLHPSVRKSNLYNCMRQRCSMERVNDMWYTPQLLGFSQYLFPRPTDYPPWAFETGFWQTSESDEFHHKAEKKLRDFLDNSKAPRRRIAVVTFGSMILQTRESLLADIVLELLAGRYHVLVLTGWGEQPSGLPLDDPRLLCWKEAPHDWVFGQASLVVHHGGAGTTGRALASGIPSIIIPVLRFADQMQWGQMIHDLQVGVLIREQNPSRTTIRHAIERVQSGSFTHAPFSGTIAGDRANSLGSLVRAEMSAETALAVIESCLCNMVLPPAEADAIHPLAGPVPPAHELNAAQRMCVRHCVPCRRLRAQLQLADTSLFRMQAVSTTTTSTSSTSSSNGTVPSLASPVTSGGTSVAAAAFQPHSPLVTTASTTTSGSRVNGEGSPTPSRKLPFTGLAPQASSGQHEPVAPLRGIGGEHTQQLTSRPTTRTNGSSKATTAGNRTPNAASETPHAAASPMDGSIAARRRRRPSAS